MGTGELSGKPDKMLGGYQRWSSITVEPRFNEVAGDRPNLFVKWRVRYIEVLFHTFYCNFGRDIEIISFVISRTSLNRGSLNRGSTVLVTSCYGNQDKLSLLWLCGPLGSNADLTFFYKLFSLGMEQDGILACPVAPRLICSFTCFCSLD